MLVTSQGKPGRGGLAGGGFKKNFIRSSENLSVGWINSGTTDSLDVTAAPNGLTTADKLIEDSGTSAHFISETTVDSLVTGKLYTASHHFKTADNGFVLFALSTPAFPITVIGCNLTTGATSSQVGSPLNIGSSNKGNGWWRFNFSLAATSDAAASMLIYLSEDGLWANRSFAGDGSSGDYLWGAQLEEGSLSAYGGAT